MERIDVSEKEINSFSNVSKFNTEKAKFIVIDNELGKIYLNLNEDEREILLNKAQLLSRYGFVRQLILPNRLIYCNDKLVGFTQYFYANSETLSTYEINSNEEYLKYLKQISSVLKFIHKSNIVLGDFSFNNILVGKDGIRFIDLESSGIDIYEPDYYSPRAYQFMLESNTFDEIINTKEFDKLSFYIEFLSYQLVLNCFTKNLIKEDRNNFLKLCRFVNGNLRKNIKQVNNYFKPSEVYKRDDLDYLGDVVKNDDLFDNRCYVLALKLQNDINNLFNNNY